MTPRPPIAPKPPASTIRAMRSDVKPQPGSENPFHNLYLRNLKRLGIWKIFSIHYSIAVIMALAVWFLGPYISETTPVPELIIKFVGTYCFLISSIIIPLVSSDLLPSLIDRDNSIQSVPYDIVNESDARMLIVMRLSALAAIPLLPIFLVINPILDRQFTPFDVIPYLQSVTTAMWVNFLMDMVSRNTGNPHGLHARRLAIVAGFVLLHIIMVGLVGREAIFFLQRMNLLKIFIDMNPFSQLYIIMEGSDMQWLLVTIDGQRLIDFRLYLFILHGVVFVGLWLLWRNFMRNRHRSQ